MKTTLTALLAICLCWASGCGKGEPAADPREGDDGRSEPAADKPLMGDDAAKKLFEAIKAKAEKGDALAQNNLGDMYAIGRGVPQDFKKAVKWWRKAAEQGDATAQWSLGVVYAHGKEGVLEDDKEAAKWFRKAAEQGNAGAQQNLGMMYANGDGVLPDDMTAYAWFNIAAANGDANAKKWIDYIAKEMTADQIAKAQELSREMLKKNPKLLNK